jgi:hypothetical protein
MLPGEFGQRGVKLGAGEAGRQDAPQQPGVLVVLAVFPELDLEEATVVTDRPDASGVKEPARRVEPDGRVGPDDAGPELDAGQVAFPDRPQAHHEPDFPGLAAGLVRVLHHGRIEQGRGLERVLLGEIRPDQLPSGLADFFLGADPVGDEREVVLQGLRQVAIPSRESHHRPG